jgi:hypothetical protein
MIPVEIIPGTVGEGKKRMMKDDFKYDIFDIL